MRRTSLIIVITVIAGVIGCKSGISAARLESGKKAYATNCQSCHMEEGNGVPGLNASLVASKYVSGDNQKLIEIVLKGTAAFAGDNTRTEYTNTMPSLALLDDKDIADVLTYLRNNFGNKGTEITTEEVKSVREKTK